MVAQAEGVLSHGEKCGSMVVGSTDGGLALCLWGEFLGWNSMSVGHIRGSGNLGENQASLKCTYRLWGWHSRNNNSRRSSGSSGGSSRCIILGSSTKSKQQYPKTTVRSLFFMGNKGNSKLSLGWLWCEKMKIRRIPGGWPHLEAGPARTTEDVAF